MAKIVQITNGSGTANIINGTFNVSAEVNGYNNESINPSTLSVVEGTDTYAFTISADGTLTLHVTEDGTSTGTPIVGATFIRTDSNGVEYGTAVTTDTNGDAVFSNVPYSAQSAPTIYYKQTSSDGDHEFSSDVQNTTLTTQTETIQIQNTVGALRTINLTDANYNGLPVDSGTITLS